MSGNRQHSRIGTRLTDSLRLFLALCCGLIFVHGSSLELSSRPPVVNLLMQSTPAKSQKVREAWDRTERGRLPVGRSIEHSLKGGQGDLYPIELRKGQVLRVDVQEQGVDVRLVLIRTVDSKAVAYSDFGFGFDREMLMTVIDEAGTYGVFVGSPKSKSNGRYQLVAHVSEQPAESDRETIEAARLLAEGLAGRNGGSAPELREAIGRWGKASALWKKLGEKYWEGYTQRFIGKVHNNLGENEKAFGSLSSALLLLRAADDRSGEAGALNDIGKVYNDQGNKPKALLYFGLSLPLYKAIGDKIGEADGLNNIGLVHNDLGDKTKALQYYRQALPLYVAAEDKAGEASALTGIGGVYYDLGERRKALQSYERALPLFDAAGDKDGEAQARNNLGEVYVDIGEPQKALDLYQQALRHVTDSGDRRGEAIILNNVGMAYRDLGEPQKALDYYKRALPLYASVGDRHGEATALNNIGMVYEDLGESRKALDYFIDALPILRSVGNPAGEAMTMNNMMSTWVSLGNRRMAIFYGKQAVNKFQRLRSTLRSLDNESQKTFLREVKDAYEKLAELLVEEGQLEHTVEVLNLYQDQQFFDLDRDPDEAIKEIATSPRENGLVRRYETEIGSVARISERLEELKRRVGEQPNEGESAELAHLEADLMTASGNLHHTMSSAASEFAGPRDENDAVPRVKEVEKFQRALQAVSRETKQPTVACYTLIGERNFHLLLISPEGGIKSYASPVTFKELNRKLEQFYALLQSDDYDARILGRELYDIILGPAEVELTKQNARVLLWSLNGTMRYLPVAALWDGEKYLVERYQNVVFTRAESERLTRRVSSHWIGVGFGTSKAHDVDLLRDGDKIHLPALPGMTEELTGIFKLQPAGKTGVILGEVFTDRRFTKLRFYGAMKKRPQLVHISSHFSFRPGDDSGSFLLLGSGEPLTLSELKKRKGLFEKVQLLTLSACKTAESQPDRFGKEIDGFAELAQRLGADAVLATLWEVREGSTARLMKDFYRGRQTKGLTKAEALQQAQLDLIYGTDNQVSVPCRRAGSSVDIHVETKYRVPFKSNGQNCFAHPYYWSPFILFGNGR